MLDGKYGKVYVWKPCDRWLTIKTNIKVPLQKCIEIENELVSNDFCGTYLSDQPGIDTRDANVNWEI